MTNVHTEIKKTNASIQETEIALPIFMTNTHWAAEFCDGVSWCEAEWRKGLCRLGLMLIAVMIISAAAGILWVLATH